MADIWACASVLLKNDLDMRQLLHVYLPCTLVLSCHSRDLTGRTCFLLQKSLLENCQSRVDRRDELKSLKKTCEKAQEKLEEKDKELATAQAENQTLRLQVVLGTHRWLKSKAK